jgi:hypothetical protein
MDRGSRYFLTPENPDHGSGMSFSRISDPLSNPSIRNGSVFIYNIHPLFSGIFGSPAEGGGDKAGDSQDQRRHTARPLLQERTP